MSNRENQLDKEKIQVLKKYNYWRSSLGMPEEKKKVPKHFSSMDCSCNMEPCQTCIGY